MAFRAANLIRLYWMWRRLSALALCGAVALWADVCRGLPSGPPEGSSYLDTPRPLAFRLSVKPGGPAFRITVRPLLLKWQGGSGDPVHAGDIEVAGCQDGKRLQLLSIMAWQPINFAATFQAQDINFDGYLDFSVLTEFAAKYGTRSYWVYDPASGRFVENELTHELGENCLGAEWHGRCWKADSIDFDPKKLEISAHYFVGVGQCGGPVDRYRLENNRLIVVHKEVLDMKPDSCTLTVSDLTAGTMRVTEVRRFDAQGEPLK